MCLVELCQCVVKQRADNMAGHGDLNMASHFIHGLTHQGIEAKYGPMYLNSLLFQKFASLWIQGGPRARMFFKDTPELAPALNKIPLVKWDKKYAYASSTHMLLPRGLNQVYDEWGGEKASGILLHTKFLDTFSAKAAEELSRGQHYAASVEYKAYAESLKDNPDLWCKWSEKYINWRQLEILGLMSKGNWA